MQKYYNETNNEGNNDVYCDETIVDVRSIYVNAPSISDYPPIIQPLSFVPYASGNTNDDAMLSLLAGNECEERPAPVVRKKKKAKFVPIFLSVLSLLVVAVMVLGKYVLQEYLSILGTSGLDYIMFDLVSVFSAFTVSDAVVPIAVALIALFALLNFITGFCTMFRRGASVFSKICLFMMTFLSLVLLFIGLANKLKLDYGLIGILGLSVISFLIAMLARKSK